MSPEQFAAHLRLQARLRDKIATHSFNCVLKEHGYKRNAAEEAMLAAKLRELEELGYTRTEMIEACGCTHKTLRKHLGPAR